MGSPSVSLGTRTSSRLTHFLASIGTWARMHSAMRSSKMFPRSLYKTWNQCSAFRLFFALLFGWHLRLAEASGVAHRLFSAYFRHLIGSSRGATIFEICLQS